MAVAAKAVLKIKAVEYGGMGVVCVFVLGEIGQRRRRCLGGVYNALVVSVVVRTM